MAKHGYVGQDLLYIWNSMVFKTALQDLCSLSIMTLFIILRNVEKNKCPITGNQLNILWCIHSVEPVKNHVVKVYLIAWGNLPSITLNLKSSLQRSMSIWSQFHKLYKSIYAWGKKEDIYSSMLAMIKCRWWDYILFLSNFVCYTTVSKNILH